MDKVAPQASGESSKVKVKVRVNIHGIFNVASASMVEKESAAAEDEVKDEPMEVRGFSTNQKRDALTLFC